MIVLRGWPEQSEERPRGQELLAVLDDEASWRYDEQTGVPDDQVKHIELRATEAGLSAIENGALDEDLGKPSHD